MKLTKHSDNPILTANPDQEWENLCVLNPAVIYDDTNQEFVMLYRAAGDTKMHHIYLGLAKSKDGIHFERQSEKPVFEPGYDGADAGCVEDPRLVKMGDWYFMTYAARPYAPGRYWEHPRAERPWVNPPEEGPTFLASNHTASHLAITQDFVTYKRLGRITDSRVDDRDVIIFPEKVNGQYVRLSRPMSWFGEGYPNKKPATWIAYSDDLMEWPAPKLLMQAEAPWESKKIGGSCPPLRTDRGWLHLYHGVAEGDGAYRVGAVMLDLEAPGKIIARTQEPILEAEFPFETDGFYNGSNGCVFPTGNVVVDDTLYVYYGAADKCICVATVGMTDFLEYMMTDCLV